jgi:NTP pyrophosphatase (non-canonical NTP hydrolase)
VSEAVASRLEQPESTSLAALQWRLERFDAERGWDAVNPVHTALHLLEEFGEVMREVLHLEGYKSPDSAAQARLGGELADVTLLLLKLSSQYGVDLERVVLEKLSANELRFPLEASRAAMQTYHERQGLEQPSLEQPSLEQTDLEQTDLELPSARKLPLELPE